MKNNKFLLYGVHFVFLSGLFFILAWVFYLFSSVSAIAGKMSLFFSTFTFICFTFFILFVLLNFLSVKKYTGNESCWLIIKPIQDLKISVGMTAYNDEESIGNSVRDFKNQEKVIKVIVIDNNSTDRTSEEATNQGATAVRESIQGFGACCIRALKEAYKTDCNIICLVEGDGTFSGSDLKKLIAYIENADMVIGTRTTRELTTPDSQMNWFMQWGNVFMSKLLQVRFWKVRLTDLGCTYRIVRKEALGKIVDHLTVIENHFLCEMALVALKKDLKIIEVPITFRKRIGKSKGVGKNIIKGFINGLKMWRLILFK